WSQPFVAWFFQPGGAVGARVMHTYPEPGTYTPLLGALDGAGNQRIQSFTVTVAPAPTRGVDFNASQVSGTVFVSVPKNRHVSGKIVRRAVVGAAAAIKPPKGYRKFRRLGANDNIPIGS